MLACRAVKRLALILALGLLASACIRSSSPFVNTAKTADDVVGAVDVIAPADAAVDNTTDDTGELPDSGALPDAPGVQPDTPAPDKDAGPVVVPGNPAEVVVATWNLHNFSKYGANEFRLDDISAKIKEINADVLAVQELKVKDGSNGSGEQAFDVLIDGLADFDGVHAPWSTKDSAVGLIWNTKTTTLDDWEVIFDNEWEAFPRAPIEATVTVTKDGKASTFKVVVLHLKAFKDSYERRRKACKLLVERVAKQTDKRYVIIGDFNDDPYDKPENNSYVGTFLDSEPDFHFVTAQLPLGTVTSTGYGTSVNGDWQDGEFLDHAVLTGALYDDFTTVTPSVLGKPLGEFDAWKKDYSDHFPVLIHLEP